MAATAQPVDLSFEDFIRLYDGEPYEYLEGELVKKPMASWIHGAVQGIITHLLAEAGYFSGSEITCKMERHYPVPDIAARHGVPETEYAFEPPEAVVEILSSKGEKARLFRKLDRYAEWGCPHIYVVDPKAHRVFRWSIEGGLPLVDNLAGIPATRIWQELARQMNPPGKK